MYYDWTDYVLLGILIFVLLILFVGLPILGIMPSVKKCNMIDDTNIPHRWGFWTGCMVQRPSGMWVSFDKYYMLEHIDSLEK